MRTALIILATLLLCPCLADPNAELMKKTGLKQLDTMEVPTFGKVHRGYPLKLRIALGDVWGRYFARLALAEASSNLPPAWRNLYFDRPGAGDIAGSRADQALSQVLGYPLTLTVVMEHDVELSPVFLYSSASVYKPISPPAERGKLHGTDIKIYCADADTAQRVLDNKSLTKRLSKLRTTSVALIPGGVSLMWAGDEPQYSEMIREHKSYAHMFNSIFDSMADLIETARPPSEEPPPAESR